MARCTEVASERRLLAGLVRVGGSGCGAGRGGFSPTKSDNARRSGPWRGVAHERAISESDGGPARRRILSSTPSPYFRHATDRKYGSDPRQAPSDLPSLAIAG